MLLVLKFLWPLKIICNIILRYIDARDTLLFCNEKNVEIPVRDMPYPVRRIRIGWNYVPVCPCEIRRKFVFII